MELEDALATLKLPADCTLQEAESAYASELSQLTEPASDGPGDNTADTQHRAALDYAIEQLRATLTDEALTIIGMPTPDLPPEDQATIITPALAPDSADDEATLVMPAATVQKADTGGGAMTREMRLGGGIIAVAVLALAIGFALYPERETEPETPPVPMLRVADQVRVLGSKWLNASDQLAWYRQQLASALNAAPDGLHGTLLNQYVVDEHVLEQISEVLKRGFPMAGDVDEATAAHENLTREAAAAKQRLSYLEQLDAAMSARNEVMMATTSLQGQGVQWPPPPEIAGTVFIDTTAEQVTALLGILTAAEKTLQAGEFDGAAVAFRGAAQKVTALQVSAESVAPELDPQLEQLLELGQTATAKARLTRPAGESAMDYLGEMQALDAFHPKTLELEASIKSSFLQLIEQRIGEDQLDSASTLARRSRDLLGPSPMLQAAENKIRARRSVLAELRFQPLQAITEKAGIFMLRVPPGGFDMGTPAGSTQDFGNGIERLIGGLFNNDAEMTSRDQRNEEPVHRVEIDRDIAISRSEITVQQFEMFVRATNYQTDAERRGDSVAHLAAGDTRVKDKNWRHDYLGEPGAPDAPVIHVSYNDAVAFTQWLSRSARARYRLPTESEFEYAARAGEPGIYPWGDGPPPDNFGNFRGADDSAPPSWGSGRAKPPVRTLGGYTDGAFGPSTAGRYELSSFGLENMLGNVAEWTLDCFLNGYTGKTGAQSAREFPGCTERVVRGTSWATDARRLRASYREARAADYSASTIGFRVVREVNIPTD